MDRENVIKEFEKICGYTLRPHEFQILNDVLALLKEQEAVEPKFKKPKIPEKCGKCQSCNMAITGSMYCRMEAASLVNSQMDISSIYVNVDSRPVWCPIIKIMKKVGEEMDRENVISAFEKIISVCKEDGCDFVDLSFEDAEQILGLLKEQEPVKPVRDEATGRIWLCGKCGTYVGFEDNDPNDPNEFDKFCRECGKRVEWEGR